MYVHCMYAERCSSSNPLFFTFSKQICHSTPQSPPLQFFLASSKLTACIPSSRPLKLITFSRWDTKAVQPVRAAAQQVRKSTCTDFVRLVNLMNSDLCSTSRHLSTAAQFYYRLLKTVRERERYSYRAAIHGNFGCRN